VTKYWPNKNIPRQWYVLYIVPVVTLIKSFTQWLNKLLYFS